MFRATDGGASFARSLRRAVLAWALVGSLLATAGSPSAPNVASAAAQVSEGAVDASGARLLAGADRYATAVVLAERAASLGVDGGVVVVSGESLVDALSAVPLAAARSGVVVLTRTAALPDVVAGFVRSHGAGGVSVVGGTAAVSDAVAAQLRGLVGQDEIDRFWGADRYETAVAVARAAGVPGGWCGEDDTAVLLANGQSLVDGVLAAPVAYAMGLPVLFTRAAALPDVLREYLTEAGVARAVLIGSDNEISDDIADELASLNVEVTRIDGATPAARSVALADAAADCGAASDEFALLDANVPVDGVAAAALLATSVEPTASGQPNGLVPVLAVDGDLPADVAQHLTTRGATTAEVTLYALGGPARITPQLMRDAIDAAEHRDRNSSSVSVTSTSDDREPLSRGTVGSRARSSSPVSGGVTTRALTLPVGTSTATTSTVLPTTTSTTEAPTATTTEPPSTTTSEPPPPASTSSTSSRTTLTTEPSPTEAPVQAPLPGTTSSTSSSSTSTTAPVPTTTTSEVPTTTTTTSEPAPTTTTSEVPPTTTTTSEPAPTTTTSEPPPLGSTVGSSTGLAGLFAEVAAGGFHSCGLLVDGTVGCWGGARVEFGGEVSGSFVSVSAGRDHSCGVRLDGSVACWGDNRRGQSFAPSGSFASVAAGGEHSCGLKVDGSVVCWGDNGRGQLDAPSGSFAVVAAGGEHSCGVKVGGSLVCWGRDGSGQASAPSGSFASVAAGDEHSCGLKIEGLIVCWGDDSYFQSRAPSGLFSAVTTGGSRSCGLQVDGAIVCWGLEARGWSVPSGRFTAVTAGDGHVCGLQDDGAIACWGSEIQGQSVVPSVDRDGAVVWSREASACRPSGPEGFPNRLGYADVSDGTFDVLAVFADFGDARHDPTHASWSKAEDALAAVEAYIEAQSYGQLDVVFTDPGEWVTLGDSYEDYTNPHPVDFAGVFFSEEAEWQAVMEAKRRGVDVTNGGQRFDALLLVGPSSQFGGGLARYDRVPTDDDPLRSTYANGNVNLQSAGALTVRSVALANSNRLPHHSRFSTTPFPVSTMAHELLHVLGINDLYPYDRTDRFTPSSDPANDYEWGRFGPMSLEAHWLVSPGGAPDQSVSEPADPASRKTAPNAVQLVLSNPVVEALGWSRWRLDWLDAAQVRCVEPGETTVELAPVAAPADGTGLAVVPVSAEELLVIEARRRVGYDADGVRVDGRYVSYVADNPSHTEATIFRYLVEQGVFAYVVNPRRRSGRLPIKVLGDDGTGVAPRYPIFGVGESAALRSDDGSVVEFTVTADDGSNFDVEIDWRAVVVPACASDARAELEEFGEVDERGDWIARWSFPNCVADAVNVRYEVLSFPNWSDSEIGRVVETSSSTRLKGDQTAFVVPTPDIAHPMVVRVRVGLGDDGPYEWASSRLVCPHRQGYARKLTTRKLLQSSWDADEVADLRATYVRVCGAAPPTASITEAATQVLDVCERQRPVVEPWTFVADRRELVLRWAAPDCRFDNYGLRYRVYSLPNWPDAGATELVDVVVDPPPDSTVTSHVIALPDSVAPLAVKVNLGVANSSRTRAAKSGVVCAGGDDYVDSIGAGYIISGELPSPVDRTAYETTCNLTEATS